MNGVILSVHRLSGTVLHCELSTADNCITNTAQRWKQTRHNDVLVLRSDKVLYRAIGTCELQEVTFVVSHPCCNEDTWSLDVLLAGPARRQVSWAWALWLCDRPESIFEVKKEQCIDRLQPRTFIFIREQSLHVVCMNCMIVHELNAVIQM